MKESGFPGKNKNEGSNTCQITATCGIQHTFGWKVLEIFVRSYNNEYQALK